MWKNQAADLDGSEANEPRDAGEAVQSGRRPPRLGRLILPVIAGALLVVSLIVGWLLFFDRQPMYPPSWMLRSFSLHVIVLTVLGVVVLVFALRKHRKYTALAAAIAIVVSASTASVPSVTAAATAQQSGVSVSLGDYLANAASVNLGEPVADKTVRYATVDGFGLDLDVWPSADPESDKAMLLIHGGAWKSGTRSMTPEWNDLLVEEGFTVFDVEYRMLDDVPPGEAWQATISDTRCALAWITANADEYGIDPDRISVLGQSAGGHLAMLTAYTAGTDAFAPSCDLPDGKIKSVVDIYGPTDLASFAEGPGSTDTQRQIAEDTLGGTLAEVPDAYKAFSPTSYLRSDVPPTISFHGLQDHLVPASQTEELEDGLASVGASHTAVYLPFSDHGFDVNWGSFQTQQVRAEVIDFLAANG